MEGRHMMDTSIITVLITFAAGIGSKIALEEFKGLILPQLKKRFSANTTIKSQSGQSLQLHLKENMTDAEIRDAIDALSRLEKAN
jgi:hypothetical protein